MQEAPPNPPTTTASVTASACFDGFDGFDSSRMHRVIRGDGAVDPDRRGALDAAVDLYRAMVRLRLLSARMVELQRQGAVPFHASSIGLEAVLAGTTLAASADDWLFPGVRAWGLAVLRGLGIDGYVHHAFGSAADPVKGRSSPDHPSAREGRVVPASGLPAAHLPAAVGAAWAARIRGDAIATLALFDDDVADGGDFHNAVNFAGVQKAPCVLFGHAVAGEGTRVPLAERAVAYGVASARVDGTDALAVFDLTRAALDRARRRLGPTVVEGVVPSLVAEADAALGRGGSSSDAMLDLAPHDPVARLADVLRREHLLATDAARAIADEARAAIEAAVASAASAPKPPPSSLFDDVYRTMPPHLAEQRRAFTPAPAFARAEKEPSS